MTYTGLCSAAKMSAVLKLKEISNVNVAQKSCNTLITPWWLAAVGAINVGQTENLDMGATRPG